MAKIKKETLEMMKKVARMEKPKMPTVDVSSTEVVTPKYALPKEPIAIPMGKGKLTLEDARKIRATTQKAMNPKTDLVAGQYDRATIQHVLDASKRYNFDPYTALAVALQESQLGNKDSNLGHLIDMPTVIESKLPDAKEAKKKINFDEYSKKYSADALVRLLMEKKDMALSKGLKDEEHILQAYNGLGTIYPETENQYHGFNMDKIYGVDLPKAGINMTKNPLYGKQIIDLRENVIKKNPEIMEIAKTYYNPNAPKQHSKQELVEIFKGKKNGKANK
jgi:hypothetical protein